ncbi:MAG: hypothetical protein FWD92_00045 [Methanomassiliicoccaceae archaeon]|nr:hypothetical protein [Methanomassiliicoccaceae archaeon]
MAKRKIADNTITIIVDEIGDPGLDTPDDPDFVMTASVVIQPIQFSNISAKYRKLWKKSELKSRYSTPEERDIVISDASELDPKSNAVFIRKTSGDNPKWWRESKNRDTAYRETLSELMDDTFGSTADDGFIVVLDRHKAITGGHGERIVEESAKVKNKKVKKCYVEDSAAGERRDILQTNDFIPREAREIIRGEKETSKLNINIRRITSKNVRIKK